MLEGLSEQLFEVVKQVEVLAQKILTRIHQRYRLDAHECRSTFLILRCRRTSMRALNLEADLRIALQENQFGLFYQRLIGSECVHSLSLNFKYL